MGKRKEWNPTITINFIPFESEAQRTRHYDMWIDCFIEGQKNRLAAERRKRWEGEQQDEPSQP